MLKVSFTLVLVQNSFLTILEWLDEVRYYSTEKNPVVVIVGNKTDLVGKTPRAVSFEMASEFANKNGYHYIETSAKSGQNVPEAFQKLCADILQKREKPAGGPQITYQEKKTVKPSKVTEGSYACGCTIL